MVALKPEVALMKDLVNTTASEWEVHQLRHELPDSEQHRLWRPKELAAGKLLTKFDEVTERHLVGMSFWRDMAQTEFHVTRVWKMMLRPAAAIYQLFRKECEKYPIRLFLCLQPASAEPVEGFLAEPACVLDEFSLQFREQFGTFEQVLSPAAQETLKVFGFLLVGNTFATESQHSRNSRKLQARSHTHAMTLRTRQVCTQTPQRLGRPCCKILLTKFLKRHRCSLPLMSTESMLHVPPNNIPEKSAHLNQTISRDPVCSFTTSSPTKMQQWEFWSTLQRERFLSFK